MLDKVSNQNKLSIFDILAEQANAPTRSNEDKTQKVDWSGQLSAREPEMKSAWRKQRELEKKAEKEGHFDIEAQRERHLNHNTSDVDAMDMSRSGHSVRSSRSGGLDLSKLGGITDMGGSDKMTKAGGKNSIFNPDAIVDALNAKSQREINKEARDSHAERRKQLEAQYRQSKQPTLDGDDYAFGNPASVLPTSKSGGSPHSPRVPSRNISMFDNADFERLTPTAGEQMEKKAEKKDDSWKKPSKTVSTREMSNEFFDKMASQAETPNNGQVLKNGNPRQNADKLFDNLIDILNKKNK